MKYDVHTVDVASLFTAAVRGEAQAENLPQKIRELFDVLYKNVDLADTGKRGLNVIYYPGWSSTKAFPIEVGVRVNNQFPDKGPIICSSTPSGRAVTTVHVGPYSLLKQAHGAIHEWCTDRDEELAGPSWEVYGHWNKDPNQLSTEIYYLLK